MFIRRFIIFALLLVLPGMARAQGSRKDDIVLNRFGQPIAGATVTVCTAGATGTPCSPLASIYSDVALTQPLANPLTSDGQGNYHFYAAPGRYMIQISGAGTAATSIPDVILAADPTSPSFQSISVAQNINALNLNLSGNLSVSGAVSSPTSVSAPQQGSAGPVQLGAHWSPGTATGLCSVPAAPSVQTESYSSGTGNFSSGTTYYVKVALFNRNGQTTAGPAASYTPASGSTNRLLVQLSDFSYRTGCYGMRVYISSSGSGGPFYQAQAWTLPSASIAGWSRNAAGLVTVTTSAAHGFAPGQYITIAGAATGSGSTSINGSFYLVAQQGSSPTKLFFFQTGTPADSGGSGGTGTVIAGLGSDSYGHIAPGDFIVATVPASGPQPPGTNTAMIDPDQVALNATCNYSANTCTAGRYDAPQGSITATTPLIVSNQQTVIGVNSGGATGKSERSCSWSDPNLGCVMVMGTANGVRISGMDIQSACNGILLTGSGPGYGSSNDFYEQNNITAGSLTGTCAAVRYQRGVWYEQHWIGNFLNGDLADVLVQSTAGADFFFAKRRWNAANLSASGLSTSFFLSHSSVTDPDRAQNNGAFPDGLGGVVEFSDFEAEAGTGVGFECINISCKFRNLQTADSVAIAGTPALVRFGTDANGGSNGPYNFVMEDSQVLATAGVSTALQFIGNYNNTAGTVSIRNSSLGGNPIDVDFNNVSVYFSCSDSTCSGYEASTGHKLINVPATATVNVRNSTTLGNPAAYGAHWFTGGIRLLRQGGTDPDVYLEPYAYNGTYAGHSGLFFYGGDPATGSNLWNYCFFVSGADCFWFQNDGSTKLFELNAAGGVNQINLGNPSSPANNKINLGLPLVDSTGATVKGALSATTSSLGGSALAVGACTSGTVSVSGATTAMAVSVSPAADPGAGFAWMGFVSSSGTVTVRVCAIAAGTPASTTYNVRVLQ